MTQICKSPPFWLFIIGSGLIAIHLTLVWKTNAVNLLGAGLLYWAAIAFRIWQRRRQLQWQSDALASLLGLISIAILLLKSASVLVGAKFLALMPLALILSWALLASGCRGFGQYWAELLALSILGFPQLLESWLIDISPQTAQATALLLWYGGFDVTLRDQVFVELPRGSVEVYLGCSGIEGILHLLGIAFLYLLIFPTPRTHKIILPIAAVVIAFVTNTFRVAIMTVLVAQNRQDAFAYWHHGEGSLLFSILAVLILKGCCDVLQNHSAQSKPSRNWVKN
ncbi:MAG: cyanoexosortase A [Microcoleaceae cyanobacterium]